MEPPDSHPDLAELEALLTDEAKESTRQHLESCAACRETLAKLKTIRTSIRQTFDNKAALPDHADQAMQSLIREQAERVRREQRRPFILRFGRIAAAAALIAALGLAVYFTRLRESEHTSAISLHDIDRNGRVDIVDAFVMNRTIQFHRSLPDNWDFNRDGQVDSLDVDIVAEQAVKIPEEKDNA